ncbi:MAG: ABC transporter transmembrane domain-containing protein [Xanthomonadaceae bacterium]|nr:ABC transporter transmembrane domain-containing protein [Xanthomonadaceae bacterium]MDP2185630.1 ABC transporter transmembrane domain-containing protein [Xanthomonadales bacterium]MDZ4116666.1 ABC transporter transmembrane domain-containing protein [Xanthomonadaceae bacterium]MDZ4376604.1 ABC transporter transmembrane domain-containing protein [Xanthomonadaceae bacterium]
MSTSEKSSGKLSSLRRLWPYASPYRGLVAGWLGFMLIAAGSTLALPIAFRLVIDKGIGGAGGGSIDRWFEILFVVAAILAIATAARFFCITVLAERIVADIRKQVFTHLMHLDMSFFERTRSGEIISRLSADTEMLRTVIGSSVSIAVRNVLNASGSAIMLAITSPRLAGMAAIVIPAVIVPIALFGRRVREQSRASQDRLADASARASETLNAMHTVQSYAREAHESERFADAANRTYLTSRIRIRTQSLMTALVILLIFGAITAVLWVGAKDVIAGNMSSGALGQFVLYAIIGAGSVGALTEVWNDVQRAAGGMARINELLRERSHIAAPAQPQPLPARFSGDVSFDAVTFHYPSRPETSALIDFTLHIRAGETVALVGPSGAGKSTVFQMLLRFFDPQTGSVKVDDHDVRTLAPADLRSRIALVPQDPVIFGADAMENLRYGRLDASDEEVCEAARLAEAHTFIQALPEGYRTYLGERGSRLSGGQQQRLAIARALLKDAPILLLDEATSALDAQSERAIQHALDRLMQGRTTLIIAHRLATVQRVDRIVVLDHGRIVAQGRHEELVAQGGLYAELARLQFAI